MKKILVTLLCIGVSACAPNSETSRDSPSKNDSPNAESPDPRSPQPCDNLQSSVFNDCIVTTSINVIENPKDYDYKNPETTSNFPGSQSAFQYRQPSRLLDLDLNSQNLRVGEYFVLSEFIQRRKGRYGILAPLLVEKLDEIRDIISGPLVINSGYRSPGYNSQISGSSKWSRHMYGDAVDMRSPVANLSELKNRCIASSASFILVYTSHVHCDWRNHPLSIMYFPAGSPPTVRPTLEAFVSAHFVWDQHAKVAGSSSLVSANVEPREESDELFVTWVITSPSGLEITATGETIEVFWDERGDYKVQAVIGGLYPHTQTVTIN